MISTDVDLAASWLRKGELIGLPTETVYGLAGNGLRDETIKRIYEIKQRPLINPLILHVPSAADCQTYTYQLPEKASVLASAFWPGPLTLVVKKAPGVPDMVTGGKDTVAIRVPAHPAALEVLRRLDFPLAAPSANPFGRISPTRAQHVQDYFQETIPMVLDGGPCREGLESTILGFSPKQEPIVLRLGAVTVESLTDLVGPVRIFQRNGKEEILAPGMFGKHYAPRAPLIFSDDVLHSVLRQKARNIALLLFEKPLPLSRGVYQICLSPKGDLREAAAKLYETLHDLDKLEPDVIIAQQFPQTGLGMVINDKLKRAAFQKHQ